ncbi:glucose-1-phosphate thymidylyltransferase [Pedobacter psychrophilus]|uniref:Glucose-1-phosphate thymidylyltransferase n=1 Tax=Pedobacter psychrophilus TaxID=1826909 RepID=A0A179DJ61_9SPHI|nr:GlmU family protein [Pedobacter psychrophilus]OAQ40740.1 glucose-1-phosphate thymidylyltransferase [Pedobacter psychrophilus]
MIIIFFDDKSRETLYPLTFTRPTADLRIGILKISEKWQHHFNAEPAYQTEKYLQKKFPLKNSEQQLFVNGSICPNLDLLNAITQLKDNEILVKEDLFIAAKTNQKTFDFENPVSYHQVKFNGDFTKINFPEDIFKLNDFELRADFDLITKGRVSQKLSATNTVIGNDIFVEEGVEAECCTFNTKYGPIYLGKNAQVWEGSHIRGAFALCNDAQVKMGAKIYGATTIGPNCRVGGEINNAVMWGNSAKGHDGYLGNAVVGEWCNFGADSNNSNLKNNYAEVKLWDYKSERFRKTGLQFCGLIMGDHAKCAINTMFNTGTVVGVGANVFGAGFPRNFIPDFSWGGTQGLEVYALNKMFDTTQKVFERRNKVFDDIEKDILSEIFDQTNKHRRF